MVGKEVVSATELPESVMVNVALPMKALGVNVNWVELTLVTVPDVNPLIVTVGLVNVVPLIVTSPFAACVIVVMVGKEADKETEFPPSVTVNVDVGINELGVNVN